jgi:hypothetical protein
VRRRKEEIKLLMVKSEKKDEEDAHMRKEKKP